MGDGKGVLPPFGQRFLEQAFGQAGRSPHQLIGVVQGDHCGATPLTLRFLPARPLGCGACKPNTVRAAAQAVLRSTFRPWARTMGKPGAEGLPMSTDSAAVGSKLCPRGHEELPIGGHETAR